MQANWAPTNALGEVAWVENAFDNAGWDGVIVAYADFTVSDVRPQLDALSRYESVRGIRQQYHWHVNPTYRFAPDAKQLISDNVMANLGYLLGLQLVIRSANFRTANGRCRKTYRALPKGEFHIAAFGHVLEDQSADGGAKWGAWHCGVWPAFPNVYNKLSGLRNIHPSQ